MIAEPNNCPFCGVTGEKVLWTSELAIAIRDTYPVSPGHALVVPRRHVAFWDDLTESEKASILVGIDAARTVIRGAHNPDAFNIGSNDGAAAGQTVMHFHMHVIPRYAGDTDDPRGGIRNVLPSRAAYWIDTD